MKSTKTKGVLNYGQMIHQKRRAIISFIISTTHLHTYAKTFYSDLLNPTRFSAILIMLTPFGFCFCKFIIP